MERLQNLSGINTNTIEGRLLIATLSQLSCCEGYRDKHPDDILHECHEIAEKIYEDAGDIPILLEVNNFKAAINEAINKFSKENDSNTPDFILAEYLEQCLINYGTAVKARDKWFGVDVWEIVTNKNTF